MTTRAATWTGMNWCRPATRLAIYLRDGMACVWCGEGVEHGAKLTLDHFATVAKTGKPDNDPANLLTCCHRCNSSRGKRSAASFARAVAAYVNHGVTAEQITGHVNAVRRRTLPRAEARALLARRGTVSKVLATIREEAQ